MNEAERLNRFNELMKPAEDRISETFRKWLIQTGFFSAPASANHHGNYEGGLFDHSEAVVNWLLRFTNALRLEWSRPDSPYIVGMFHDLCKIDQYKEIVDKEGVVMFGRMEPDGRAVHFEEGTPILDGHGDKSVILLSQFMTLTTEEMYCIRFHMGAYVGRDMKRYDLVVRSFPNVMFTHTADVAAGKVQGV